MTRFIVTSVLVVLGACSPSLRTAPELKASSSPETIEKGRYLANAVLGCVDCHSPRDFTQPGAPVISGKEFSGSGYVFAPGSATINGEDLPFTLQPPNITQHPEKGIGAWTDGEIARAIREGVSRDGRALFPLMPYPAFKHLSDEEVLAVIAYLRTIAPSDNTTVERDLDFPLGMIVNFIPEPLEGPVSAPDVTDSVARGKRLVEISGCHDCHSPSEQGERIEGEELSGGVVYYSKSLPFGTNAYVVSSNLTPDEETGLGKVTREQFLQMIRDGKGQDGRNLNSLMPWVFARQMTDEDLGSIYDYLRTVPPKKKNVQAEVAKYVE